MKDEEKAIEILKELKEIFSSPDPFKDDKDYDRAVAIETVLNLINKQSKQIQEYKRLLERNEQIEKDILIKQGWLNE